MTSEPIRPAGPDPSTQRYLSRGFIVRMYLNGAGMDNLKIEMLRVG